MKQALINFLIIAVFFGTIMYVYQNYRSDIYTHFFGEPVVTMYVESVPITVTVADTRDKQIQGLSGVSALPELQGKLFVYDKEDYYSMWMRDMLISIDMLWINNDLEIVHIEENVSPDTFPDTFVSNVPARFVLEMNAFFAKDHSIDVGDKVVLPPSATPADLIKILQ